MHGRPNPQRSLLAIVDMEEQVPKDHPLRRIKAVADVALTRLPAGARPHVCPCGARLRAARAAVGSLTNDRPVLGA